MNCHDHEPQIAPKKDFGDGGVGLAVRDPEILPSFLTYLFKEKQQDRIDQS
jgi:hypothetical protein